MEKRTQFDAKDEKDAKVIEALALLRRGDYCGCQKALESVLDNFFESRMVITEEGSEPCNS